MRISLAKSPRHRNTRSAMNRLGLPGHSSRYNRETMKAAERDKLMETLKARFEKNMHRHKGMKWATVEAKLEGNAAALETLSAMEATGGEPDVVGDGKSKHITFCDCSAESPSGRRSLCYDDAALKARKEN